MYDYLTSFEKFYKCYSGIHCELAGVSGNAVEDLSVFIEAAPAQKVHTSVSCVIINILKQYGGNVDYLSLIDDNKHFFSDIIEVVERHHRTGAKLGYMLSGLNLVFECFSRMTTESQMNDKNKITMLENLRKIYAAYLVISAGKWVDTDITKYRKTLEENNLLLETEKHRFVNYIDMRRSPVVFVDDNGNIIKLNHSAKDMFAIDISTQEYNIMDVLDYHFISFESFVKHYCHNEQKTVRMMNGDKFSMSVLPLLYKNGVACEYVLVFKSARKRAHAEQPQKAFEDIKSDAMLKKLTYTETQICSLINKGVSSKSIADILNISIETVKTHRKNIRKKLNLRESGISMYSYIKNQGLT